jgi:hypothetical protein
MAIAILSGTLDSLVPRRAAFKNLASRHNMSKHPRADCTLLLAAMIMVAHHHSSFFDNPPSIFIDHGTLLQNIIPFDHDGVDNSPGALSFANIFCECVVCADIAAALDCITSDHESLQIDIPFHIDGMATAPGALSTAIDFCEDVVCADIAAALNCITSDHESLQMNILFHIDSMATAPGALPGN